LRTIRHRFGEAVARRRREVQLSQDELGDESGLHRTFIGRVERGETNVTLETAEKIAAALKTPLKELLGEADRKR